MLQKILGLSEPLTGREYGEMRSVTLGVSLHLGITMMFFFISTFFYKGHSEERQKEVDQFFYNVNTE